MSAADPAVAPREIEATLIVWADAPRLIVGWIAGIETLGHFRLISRPAEHLYDVYADTASGQLRAARLALRVRAVGDLLLLALKEPPRPAGGGAVDRPELELPWCDESLRRVLERLATLGVPLAPPAGAVVAGEPLETLAALGLRVVQDRTTHRRPRDLLLAHARQPVAELALDSVRYEFAGQEVWVHEVEVEARAGGGVPGVQQAAAALREQFGASLRPWPHGKLETGIALEGLVRAGRLEGRIGAEHDLKRPGLELLEAALAA